MKTLLAMALLLACRGATMPPASAKIKLLSFKPGQLSRAGGVLPQSVPQYDLPANRLVFDSHEVRLTVEIGFDSEDHVYRIGGLLNPDIQVVRGARLTITVVSLGVPNVFLVRSHPPPFSHSLLGSGGPWRASRQMGGVHFPVLPPLFRRGGPIYTVTEVLLAQTSGVAWWGSGDSGEGTYGRIIVVP